MPVIIGGVLATGGSLVGTWFVQRLTAKRELELQQWRLRSEAYVDLVNWTAWIEHWYIVGSPDRHERPYTVEMSRTAAKVMAYGDEVTGRDAYRLLSDLHPYVSRKDIRDQPPPPEPIRELAARLAESAKSGLSKSSLLK
jgi:hypothetical protein